MIDKFILSYVQKIALEPEKVKITKRVIEDNFYEIEILASSVDIGRLIGKDGKMIGAMKTFISGLKAKDGSSYKIVVKSISENIQ